MKKLNEQTKIKIYSVDTNAPVCPKIKKKDDTKIFEIKKLNNVGADASVRPQKKKEKNNRAGRPKDAQPLQALKSNLGITLIALIITIIVLLILAGITLNMVIGENGIFAKATNAKNKTEVAQYEEELRMSVLEMQTDEATKGTTFNMGTIRKNLKQKIQELQNTDDIEITSVEESETIEGIYKGYEFTIDEKYVAHIGEKTTGIRILTNIEPTGWTKGPVKVNITIKSNNGLAKIKPENEEEIDVGGKTEYVITKENIVQNTIFKYEVTDNQGTTTNKTIEIKNIDTNAPTKCEIEKTENTEEGLKITVNAEDAESGIEKIEYYVSKASENNYKKYETNPINLESGTYNIYVVAYDKARNIKQSSTIQNIKVAKIYKNITAQMVANEPAKYYGLKVTDYTSQNGQNDWKIFYSDGTHIFLITGDYINTAESDRINSNTGMVTSKYCAYWSWNSVPDFQTVDKEVLTRFKATEYKLQSEINNSKCVSILLNVDNWSSYKDSENKAENVIGSPTVEMWMDSWNNLYENVDGKLYRRSGTNGYCVGTDENPTSYMVSVSSRDGYKNKLYYPHQSSYMGCEGYWLASSCECNSNSLIYANYGGNLGVYAYYLGSSFRYYAYNKGSWSLRPVVSLNTGITVNATDKE